MGREGSSSQRLPSLLSMLWKAGTGASTIVALAILIVAPTSLLARYIGGCLVLLALLGVTVFYLGIREGHRIALEISNEETAQLGQTLGPMPQSSN